MESREGYGRAMEMLHRCLSDDGFLATPTRLDNYRRVWGRDSTIMGLAGLISGEAELIDGCRRTLQTLVRFQGPHGEIPSNVDPETDRVSYGGTAGRVDSNLWFAITCGEYWKATRDDDFLESVLRPLERVRTLLGSWEFNTRGLLYVPPTGDWADEYLQSGYVLYDQLLYYQAQRELSSIHRHWHQSDDHLLDDRITRLKHLIRANYWFADEEETPDDIYHPVLYEKGRQAVPHRRGCYWMPFFSPLGYGYRFDGMANALAMLLGIADDEQCGVVDDYIAERICPDGPELISAFHPVITPKDEDWDDLQMTFSHTFKNAPYEFHNGGRWPLVTCFYAAALAARDRGELASQYAEAIHSANRLSMDDEAWAFPEFLHGQTRKPGGTSQMGWSAAAAIIAEGFIEGKRLFAT